MVRQGWVPRRLPGGLIILSPTYYWCVLRREWMGMDGTRGCWDDYWLLWIIPENSLRLAPVSYSFTVSKDSRTCALSGNRFFKGWSISQIIPIIFPKLGRGAHCPPQLRELGFKEDFRFFPRHFGVENPMGLVQICSKKHHQNQGQGTTRWWRNLVAMSPPESVRGPDCWQFADSQCWYWQKNARVSVQIRIPCPGSVYFLKRHFDFAWNQLLFLKFACWLQPWKWSALIGSDRYGSYLVACADFITITTTIDL